jgi:hypothetical protein
MRLRGVTLQGLIFALLVGGASPAFGQATITMGALVGEAVTATTLQNLQFGRTFPGISRVVAPTSATAGGPMAGLVYVKGRKNKDVLVSFTLPASLTNGSNSLPIGTYTGCHSETNTTVGCTPFTPSFAGTVMTLSNGLPSDPPPKTVGHLYLFIGATVSPTPAQAAGTYAGTIVVNVVYFN